MSRVFTQASSLVRINEGQETEEFLSFLMKDGGTSRIVGEEKLTGRCC
jgi:hypothetical protein